MPAGTSRVRESGARATRLEAWRLVCMSQCTALSAGCQLIKC